MGAFHDVKIVVNTMGHGTVHIDGILLRGCRAVAFSAAVDTATVVTFEIYAGTVDVTTMADVAHKHVATEVGSPQ